MSGHTQKRHRQCAHVASPVGFVGRSEFAKKGPTSRQRAVVRFDCGRSTERCRRPHSERLCSAVQSPKGQVSRARDELTGVSLAPKDESTLAELRSRKPQSRVHHIPQAVTDHIPKFPLQLDAKTFAKCLQTVPSGSACGPGGCTNEMLGVCLDCTEIFALLVSAAEDFDRAETLPTAPIFHLGNDDSTLEKGQWRPRHCLGIVFQTTGGQNVGQPMQHQVNNTCAPFQFALSRQASIASGTRSDLQQTWTLKSKCCSSTELVRMTTCPEIPSVEIVRDAKPPKTLVVRDISVWETVVLQVERFRKRVPRHSSARGWGTGRLLDASPFQFGHTKRLRTVKQSLLPGELLFAFLDDISSCHSQGASGRFMTCSALHCRNRLASSCTMAKRDCETKTGVHPSDIDQLGPEVWCKDGVRILGIFWFRTVTWK